MLMQGMDDIDRTVSNAVVVDENKHKSVDTEDPKERVPIVEGGIAKNSFTRPISPAEITLHGNVRNENIPRGINADTMIDKNDFSRNFRGVDIVKGFLTSTIEQNGTN